MDRIKKFFNIKWNMTAALILSFLLPSLAVFATAGIGIGHHERAMSKVMASYVENLAENVVFRVESANSKWALNYPVELLKQLQVFVLGPSLPGWIAVVDEEGKVLVSSPGAEETLAKLWRGGIPLGRAVEVENEDGEKYTVAVLPAVRTFVVAAVEWNQLMGPMIQSSRMWPILMITVAIAGLISIWLLWKWAIGPIKVLSDQISDLRWGCELSYENDLDVIWEVKHLRSALCRLSRDSKEKVELWNRYLREVVKVQEDEKTRIAREIHDGPVQEVTALIQRIRLALRGETKKGMEDDLILAEDIGRETVQQLRELCNQLSPPWLDLGIDHALTELVDRLTHHLGVVIELNVDDGILERKDRTLAFFRISQEAIHNAVRHGKAGFIYISVCCSENKIVLSIKDNGSGFEVPDDFEYFRATGHRGFLNMRERIQLIKGTMSVKSSPGNGCELTFEVLNS